MARARIVVVGLMVFCLLASGAMAKSSSSDKHSKGDDDPAATDDDNFSKKDYKDCYKANPACVGECVDTNDDGELECTYPEGEDADTYDLCAGDKHTKGSWAPWTDDGATMACTCADGFVTSAKVREQYADSDKMPPASKMCTVECSGEVQCLDGNGPFDCFCLNGDDDEGAEEYISKKDQADAEKEVNDAAKDDYKTAVDDAKQIYEDAVDEAKQAYEDAKQAAKDEYENAKGDDDAKSTYKDAVDAAKSDFETAKSDAKDAYETAKDDAKQIYEDAKSDKHGDDEGNVKKAATKKTETVAAPAKPAAAAAAAPAKPVVAPATPAAPKA